MRANSKNEASCGVNKSASSLRSVILRGYRVLLHTGIFTVALTVNSLVREALRAPNCFPSIDIRFCRCELVSGIRLNHDDESRMPSLSLTSHSVPPKDGNVLHLCQV